MAPTGVHWTFSPVLCIARDLRWGRVDETFGEDTTLSPAALVGAKQLELTTPDVVIRVNPERADLVKTEVIDGRRYILIRADEGVELNGVPIAIRD